MQCIACNVQANLPAGLAPHHVLPRDAGGNCGVIDVTDSRPAPLHLFPHRLPVQHRVGCNHHQHQGTERVSRDTDVDMHEIAQLHIRNEDTEQIHFDHRTGPQALDPAEHRPQMSRRLLHAEAEQHIRHAQQFEQRRGDGGEQHDQSQLADAMPLQSVRAREQIRAQLHTRGADAHQRHQACHAEQRQGGKIERQRTRQRVMACLTENGGATQA